MEDVTMTISDAAKKLATTELTLRKGIEQGLYPFGVAVKSKGGKRCKYIVYRKRLEMWLEGKDLIPVLPNS